MHRRDFLGSLVAVAGGLVLPDPERRRVYSFARELRVPGLGFGSGPIRVFVNGVEYKLGAAEPPRVGDILMFESGAVAAWWSESPGYDAEKIEARFRKARARSGFLLTKQ